MNKYKCPVCGGISYSSASPDMLKDDRCLNSECSGMVELEEAPDER